MSKTINDKLKASVKASLDKAAKKAPKKSPKKQTSDEPVEAKLDDATRDYLGIPKYSSQRPKEICVYKIKYHNRARLDHTKYPNERTHKLENSPIFATHKDADKWCREKEKEDKENLYFADMTWIPEPDVPKDIMKKIVKRGW